MEDCGAKWLVQGMVSLRKFWIPWSDSYLEKKTLVRDGLQLTKTEINTAVKHLD